MINKALTGHIYYRSPYECDDNCGTCDGARCDSCKAVYTVSGLEELFYSHKDAEEAEAKVSALYNSTGNYDFHGDSRYFFIKEGKLYVNAWSNVSNASEDVPCSEESSLYAEKFADAERRWTQFQECKCVDKTDPNIESDCTKYGCTDGSCYNRMLRGNTNKKWYM